MQISLRLLQLIEWRYLNSLYYINRFMGMIFRNEQVISVLFYIKDLKLLTGNKVFTLF